MAEDKDVKDAKVIVYTSYGNNHWTSTPQDGIRYRNPNSNTANDRTLNNSLLFLLDTQCQVQHDTTQALSKIIQLQDTRANDMYVMTYQHSLVNLRHS